MAKETQDKKEGVGSVVRAALKEGKTNEQALEIVQKRFPDAKTTVQSVSWYRNDMRGKGEKVPTAKEAKEKQEKAAAKKS